MIIWAFPGIGKSNIYLSSVIDCDVAYFKFNIPEDTVLHNNELMHDCSLNSDYPDNYIKYVKDCDLVYDYILINCEPDLISSFSDVHIIYPDASLKDEYMHRYVNRGDNNSFISYMDDSFEEMVRYFDLLPHKYKVKVTKENKFLNDILGEMRMEFMSKTAMVAIISEADKYGLFNIPDGLSVEKTADEIFEGHIEVDFDNLKNELELAYKNEALEKKFQENRNGLSHTELTNLIMDSMVSGAADIYYGEVAPYSHGYRYTFNGKDYEMYNCSEFFDCPEKVCTAIEKGQFVIDIDKLASLTRSAYKTVEDSSYTYSDTLDWKLDDYYYHHIHRLKDVHELKGLDAIVSGKCMGTYSNCMACKENTLIRQMVAFKGYCLDYFMKNSNSDDFNERFQSALSEYHSRHGLDISDIDKWCNDNFEKTFESASFKAPAKKR